MQIENYFYMVYYMNGLAHGLNLNPAGSNIHPESRPSCLKLILLRRVLNLLSKKMCEEAYGGVLQVIKLNMGPYASKHGVAGTLFSLKRILSLSRCSNPG